VNLVSRNVWLTLNYHRNARQYIFARIQKVSIQLAVQSIYNIWYYFCKYADTNKEADTNIFDMFVYVNFSIYCVPK